MKKVKQGLNQASTPEEDKGYITDLSSVYLNVGDIAKYLGMKSSNIYSKVESREIPHYRIGRLIRFKLDEVEAWMEARKDPVVGATLEARKAAIKPAQRRAAQDVNAIVKKTIEDVRKRQYTHYHGKPDQFKGLRKEVEDGHI